MIDSMYEVTRNDYKGFIRRLYPEKIYSYCVEYEDCITYGIKSLRTDNILCARTSFKEDGIPEKYFIVNYPEDDEWGAAVPVFRYVCSSPEEFQKILNFYSEKNKNERTI